MLLLTIAYGRFLGAAKFGELYFAVTFISLIGVPMGAGYNNQIIRDVAQEPGKALKYFSNVLLIKLGFWPILYAIALLASWLLGYAMEVRILVGICGFYLLSVEIADIFRSLHFAFERPYFPAVGTILETGLTAVFGILLLKFGAGVQVMALVMVAASLASVIWLAIWFFRLVGTGFIIDLALIRQIVRTNIPFLIYGALLVSYDRIDTVLLSLMTNNTVVGWYGAGIRLFDALDFLPIIVISTIMYPIFSKLSTTSEASLKVAVEKSVNFMLFCSIPIAVLLIVAAPKIIGFLYRQPDFSHSIPVLQALAPGVVFLYINYALGAILLSKRQDRKIPIMAAIALAFTLGLNLILIPLYQHVGAAIVTSLNEVLLCCIGLVLIPRHMLPFGSLRVAFKALIASLVMALAVLALHAFNILVILPIAMVIYLGVSLLVGTIPREDYQAAYTAIRQKTQPGSLAAGQISQENEVQ